MRALDEALRGLEKLDQRQSRIRIVNRRDVWRSWFCWWWRMQAGFLWSSC